MKYRQRCPLVYEAMADKLTGEDMDRLAIRFGDISEESSERGPLVVGLSLEAQGAFRDAAIKVLKHRNHPTADLVDPAYLAAICDHFTEAGCTCKRSHVHM